MSYALMNVFVFHDDWIHNVRSLLFSTFMFKSDIFLDGTNIGKPQKISYTSIVSTYGYVSAFVDKLVRKFLNDVYNFS